MGLAALGFVGIVALEHRKVPGAVIICILAVSLIGWLAGTVARPPESVVAAPPSLAPTFLQLDIAAALEVGLLAIVFAFLMVDLFDTSGTLVAVLNEAGLTDGTGRIPHLRRALVADSSATIVGSLLGTSTTTSYIESAAGVRAGGRTGLTALVVAGLFLVALVFAPGCHLHSRIRHRSGHHLRRVRDGEGASGRGVGRPDGERPGDRHRDRDALHLFDRHGDRARLHRLRPDQGAGRPQPRTQRRGGDRGGAVRDPVRGQLTAPGTRMSTPDRRRFLRQSALWAAAAPLVPVERLAALHSGASARPQDAWVARARAEIPAATGSVYFQTGGIGPSPTAVIATVSERLDFQNRGPADPRYATDMARIEPDLRAQLGRVFGAGGEEVALTHSTSEGISIVAWSLNWQPGDEVIISNIEHPANVIPWYVLRDRFGIAIREIDLAAGTSLMDEIRAQLSPRTRMVSISHVSRNNGRTIRTDESAELGNLLRGRGVRYHLGRRPGPGLRPHRLPRARLRLLLDVRAQVAARSQGHGRALRPA